MKKSLWKNNLKVIVKTRRRFISILIMAFLGVGFFSGLVATGPDMKDSFDEYADSSNLFDIDIVSTMGFTENDINEIKNIDGIESVEGVQTKDTIVKIEDKESVCKVIEYNENMNVPVVIEGRLPEKSDECLLDCKYSIVDNMSNYIGKTVVVENDDINFDGSLLFAEKTLTIVGIAETPLYISNERGNTSVGNGTIGCYIYTRDDVINLNYYTNVYARVSGAKELKANSDEYWARVNPVVQRVEDMAEEKENSDQMLKWFVQTRKDNLGYTNIVDAITTITNISKLFPVIFYLVAVLISLTSMTRMIEEERTEIGTLKALGYTNVQIIIKYILYAFLACMIGGFLGMTVGFYLIPNIVWNIYSAIYTIPEFYTAYRLDIGLQGLIIAFLCICGATIVVAIKELKNMPAVLMRPKAPKNGRKIWLEKCTFFWKRLNFSKKVTTRNIFRYKKRAIMTVVGIAGCTGLMVTGFGLRDSVLDIPESQYGDIFTYDMSISLSNNAAMYEVENLVKTDENINGYSKVCASSVKIKGSEANYDTAIFIPDSIPDFEKMCNLKDVETHEKLNISNEGIIISDKIAEFVDAKVGDSVVLIDNDNLEYSFKVTGIAENYVSNYIYMSKEFYEANVKSYKTNMLLLDVKEISKDEKENLSEKLLNINGVASVSMISDMMNAIEDMLGSLNYVVIILIVASALLAFVVLYNLANINIGERQREIATLKVLGFYDKEVDNYINKENLVFTAFGVIIGLVFGYFLTDMIVASVEIDKLRFIRRILPQSYVFAAVITTIFSLTVNYIIHFVLKKIDMIESLKSVE